MRKNTTRDSPFYICLGAFWWTTLSVIFLVEKKTATSEIVPSRRVVASKLPPCELFKILGNEPDFFSLFSYSEKITKDEKPPKHFSISHVK